MVAFIIWLYHSSNLVNEPSPAWSHAMASRVRACRSFSSPDASQGNSEACSMNVVFPWKSKLTCCPIFNLNCTAIFQLAKTIETIGILLPSCFIHDPYLQSPFTDARFGFHRSPRARVSLLKEDARPKLGETLVINQRSWATEPHVLCSGYNWVKTSSPVKWRTCCEYKSPTHKRVASQLCHIFWFNSLTLDKFLQAKKGWFVHTYQMDVPTLKWNV